MSQAFRTGWSVVKGHYPMGEIKTPKKDKCESCGISTWHRDLGIEDEGQADGQMVDVGGGPPMWLCDDCKDERGD